MRTTIFVLVLVLCRAAVAQQAIGTNYSGGVSFGAVTTPTLNATTQYVGTVVVTNPDNTIWIMSSNGFGTNSTFTGATNYGSPGQTNWTWMDASGWHNTNNSAAGQGVDISKGTVGATAGTRTFTHDSTHTVITNTATLTSSEWTAGSQKEWYSGSVTMTIDKTNGQITANSYFSSTNTSGSGALVAGNTYYTNLAGNITLAAPTGIPASASWAITVAAQNTSGADRSVTMPSGVVGNASGTSPGVAWVTNNTTLVFQIVGFGSAFTNLLSPH